MITSFSGNHAFLSNFYCAPVIYERVYYLTNEHFFQAHKAAKKADFLKIINADTAGKAKRIGRHVELVQDWDRVKDHAMRTGLRLKFDTHPGLQQALIATGTRQLIEGNNWGDRYWGAVYENGSWVGENKLGLMLMMLRTEYSS